MINQNFANSIPLEMKISSRFFAVGTKDNPKAPKVKNWSTPKNQTTIDNVEGLAGFDTCGHGNGADYLFLDFDHVLKDGDFVNDSARALVEDFTNTFRNAYIEISFSNHGLHAFLIPTADKFGMLNAGSKATVYFSDSRDKDAPKLELFYKSKARYCLVTGNKFNSGYNIPRGEEADIFLAKLLDIITNQQTKDKEIKAVLKEISHTDTPPEYHRDLAVELWQFGNLANAGRGDWLPCISALKNLGFSLSEVKSMCEHSARYDENAFDTEFESLTDISNFGIETLIGKCRNFDFKAFARKWYTEHPQFNKSAAADEMDSFELEKNSVLADSLVDPEINKFDLPFNFTVTNHGIKKIGKKEISTICPRPILIKEKFFNLEDKTFKLTLEHMDARHKWHTIPPQPRGTIFNKNKIVDTINFGLPVTTGNASKVVDWLFNFDLANEINIPFTYTVNRCGWFNYNGVDYFIDPRITNTVATDESKKINIIVDSDNQMAKDLQTAGTLEEWKKAYLLVCNSTIARFNVAAALAPALLKVLGERNFVVYTYGKTRGGKSTSLYLAASAVGNSNLVRVFDATSNGLTAAAMNTNHYPFYVDEKQSATKTLKEEFQRWIYNDANGIERTRADKNGNPRPIKSWQHITLCNGETKLLDDNATGGAHTRILQIAAPDEILDPETCKKIRLIISDNHGHAYPLFIDQIKKENLDELRQHYADLQDAYKKILPARNIELLPDYIKYVALICIADELFIKALGVDLPPLEYLEIFKCLPTIEETDDATREENIVSAFIAMKALHFDSDTRADTLKVDCYGKYKDGFLYIIATVLNQFLTENGFTPSKVAADLVKSGYFIPGKTDEGKKTPRTTTAIRINGKLQRCYQVKYNNDED